MLDESQDELGQIPAEPLGVFQVSPTSVRELIQSKFIMLDTTRGTGTQTNGLQFPRAIPKEDRTQKRSNPKKIGARVEPCTHEKQL